MYHFSGFPYLTTQAWIQVKGLPMDDGAFLALEITVAADEDIKLIRIQGIIQELDSDSGVVRISNKQIPLAKEMPIKGTRRSKTLKLAELQPGHMLRIDGHYKGNHHFVPELLSVQTHLDFNIDKLFGQIENVDQEKKTLQLLGLPVIVTPDTSVELSWTN